MDSITRSLQSMDLHPKLVKDFAVRTKSGATVSIVASLLAVVLLCSEWSWYRTVEKIEHMEVDPIRNGKFRVNFDVTFPRMPCAIVSLDAMDSSGQHQLDILHNVFKRRLDAEGNPISDGEREGSLKTVRTRDDLVKEKQRAIAQGRSNEGITGCGNCYGAGEDGECCNTCDDVRAAYRRRKWTFETNGIEQCEKEGFYGDATAQLASVEGCNMYGHVEVPKVAGNVHFAPGHAMQQVYSHVHDLVSFTLSSFNITHKVNSLSFGVYYPGSTSPLDGHVVSVPEGAGMHQYFVKLVPTIYEPLVGVPIPAYQFSVTEHLKTMDLSAGHEGSQGLLPGVFFNYELSPLQVRITEQRRSFSHFLTRVFAILGGVYTVMGMIDALLHRLVGKAGVLA